MPALRILGQSRLYRAVGLVVHMCLLLSVMSLAVALLGGNPNRLVSSILGGAVCAALGSSSALRAGSSHVIRSPFFGWPVVRLEGDTHAVVGPNYTRIGVGNPRDLTTLYWFPSDRVETDAEIRELLDKINCA